MIASWMLNSLLVGGFVCIAAVAAERIVGMWNGPRRLVWVAAMAITLVVPARLATNRQPLRERSVAAVTRAERAAVGTRRKPPVTAEPALLMRIRSYEYQFAKRMERPARVVWVATSTLFAAAFLFATLRVRRERRTWTETKVGGHPVLVTPDVGPALVGFLDPRIVVPRWALDLGPLERQFMLHHELEHLGAEDPRLLMIAGLLLVVFPWNAALWWMRQRLRLAIEIDCDTRVVQTCGAPREYGLFLLAVGERRTRSLPLAASLAERRSFLERRIRAMTTQRPRYRLLASLPLAAICAGAMTLAAQTPQPAGAFVFRVTPTTAPADRIQLSTDHVRALLASRYPGVVDGSANENLLTVVISSTGQLVATGMTRVAFAYLKPTSDGARVDSAQVIEQRLVAMTRAARAAVSPSVVVPADSGSRAERERVLVVKALTLAESQNGMMNLEGIGQVDPSLVHDLYTMTFEPGAVSAHAVRVRVLTLTGSSTTK